VNEPTETKTRAERLAWAVRELRFPPELSAAGPDKDYSDGFLAGYNNAIDQVAALILEHPPEDRRIVGALEKLLRAEEKYVRDTGLPQPDDFIQDAVNEARLLLGWPAVCEPAATPVDRPTCGKAHGMCAMMPGAQEMPKSMAHPLATPWNGWPLTSTPKQGEGE
jgi:hypothetical protein